MSKGCGWNVERGMEGVRSRRMVHYGRSVMMGGVLHNGRFSRLFGRFRKLMGVPFLI